jgi:hypothetical protein
MRTSKKPGKCNIQQLFLRIYVPYAYVAVWVLACGKRWGGSCVYVHLTE